MESGGSGAGVGDLGTVLVLCFGLAAVGYGVAQLTAVVSYTPPGFVYLLAGALLLLWSGLLVRRR